LLTTISGATTLGTFKQGECVNLIQTCDNCTYNNISKILYPNANISLSNIEMTKDDTYYNYSYCLTNDAGTYIVNGFGDLNGVKTVWNYDFQITPSGNSMGTSSAIIYSLILFVMFGVTLMFLFFGTITETAGVKLFFNVLGYISMFLTICAGYVLLQSSEVQSNVSFLVSALIYVTGIVLIIIMFFIFINQTRQALQLMRVNKGFGSELDNPPLF
jgi:hypothetical protein